MAVGIVAVALVAVAMHLSQQAGPSATATAGPFRLTISAPAAHYLSTQEIRGVSATLVYEGPDPSVRMTHPAMGPINFAIAQVGGPHHTSPIADFACRSSDLRPGDSVTHAYVKTGGFNGPNDPDQPWLDAFFARQGLFLDPGQWTITAIGQFQLGGCAGTPEDLRASITITVDPGAASAGPTPVPAE